MLALWRGAVREGIGACGTVRPVERRKRKRNAIPLGELAFREFVVRYDTSSEVRNLARTTATAAALLEPVLTFAEFFFPCVLDAIFFDR